MPEAAEIDLRLATALPAGSLYAVGGRVRDEIRSRFDGVPRPAKDLDYVATGLTLDELVERLKSVGRAELVGASFAVVKCTIDGQTVDVALPRRERSTGVGHRDFAVESGPEVSLEDDLARRDFRMNMIARAIGSGALLDPYGGEADIEARRIGVRWAGAFEEDPLRLLRACQFAARFEFAVTPGTLAAMRAAAPLVATVSAERVRDELIKLIELAPRPSIGFDLMRETGLLPFVLPELAEGIGVEQNVYHAYDVFGHGMHTIDATPPGDLLLRIAALLHDVGKPRTKEGPHFYRHEVVGAEMVRGLLERLRFPGETVERAERLVRQHMYHADPGAAPATLRRFINRIGTDNLAPQFALRAADIAGSGLPKRGPENELFEQRVWQTLEARPPLSVKDLAVNGADAIAALIDAGRLSRGSRGGPEVGRLLRAVLEAVLDDPDMGREGQLALLQRDASAAEEAPNVSQET
jgi:putative nucleotidyltransferase with HDIG domain